MCKDSVGTVPPPKKIRLKLEMTQTKWPKILESEFRNLSNPNSAHLAVVWSGHMASLRLFNSLGKTLPKMAWMSEQ